AGGPGTRACPPPRRLRYLEISRLTTPIAQDAPRAQIRHYARFQLAFICWRSGLAVAIQIIQPREDRNGLFADPQDRTVAQARLRLHGPIRFPHRKRSSEGDG